MSRDVDNFFGGIGVWKNKNNGEDEVTGEDTLGLTLYFTTSRDACDTECVRDAEGGERSEAGTAFGAERVAKFPKDC